MNAVRSLVLVWALLLGVTGALAKEVCLGTDLGLALPPSLENHYEAMRLLYTNCQVVHGNLEITHLHGNPDLSFLQDIEEVQGHVLVAHVSVALVPLDGLRIIRGSQLFNSSSALAALENTGLRTLRLRSLTEILVGGVYIWNNPQLCFPDPQSIVWRDTLDQLNTYSSKHTLQRRAENCPLCHSSCGATCWGEAEQDCQTLSRVPCASGCHRCRGPLSSDCCHPRCAAGCTGPTDSHCLACRDFDDGGVCKEYCPLPIVYDAATFQTRPNPHRKFSFGAACVKTCPHNYLHLDVACSLVCPASNQEVTVSHPDGTETQKCERCEGDCPKVCCGLGMGNLREVRVVTAANVEQYNSCTKIEGGLAFLPQSFASDPQTNTAGLSLEQLRTFRNLEEITGYLYIEAWPENWTDLSVFENLKVIRGRMLYKGLFSLLVQNVHIESLGLRSLRSVSGGLVMLHNNPRLCYTSSPPWATLLLPSQRPRHILSKNQDPQTCEAEGRVCDAQCRGGCWGPGPAQCVSF